MQFAFRSIVACLAAVVLSMVTGCGGDGDESAAGPATINGSEGGKGQPGSGSQPRATDPLHPTVLIDTSLGSITVRLDKEKAPITVENFLSYVDGGHYDQTIFHEVIKDYPRVILAGGFTAELSEKEVRTPVYNEARNGLKNRRGTIAMARQADAIHSATRFFFFNLTDNEVLDHKDETLEGYGYCVFGQVTEGMNVADKIVGVEVKDTEQFERIPVNPVTIRSIRQIR